MQTLRQRGVTNREGMISTIGSFVFDGPSLLVKGQASICLAKSSMSVIIVAAQCDDQEGAYMPWYVHLPCQAHLR